MKLTAKEHRALAELAKPVGTRNYDRVHGRTIHALERKGLFGPKRNGEPGGQLTAAGRAELAAVPNIFDDLFDKEHTVKKTAKKSKRFWKVGLPAKEASGAASEIVDRLLARDAAEKRLHTISNAEIDAHPLLTDPLRRICKELRDVAKRAGDEFTMLDFAKISLRASGNDYAAVTDECGLQAAVCDAAHQRAALLYAYELVKAGPPIVTETLNDRGTLRDLEIVASHA